MREQPNSDTSRQDALRAVRKQIAHSLLLSLAALGVIAIACYAWFVQNTHVTGGLGTISAESAPFELASAGNPGAYDPETPDQWRVDGQEKTYEDLTVYQTGDHDTVLWRVTAASNLANYSATDGIYPGQEGTLEFYLIPSRTGTMTFTFQLELLPLDSSYREITNDETLSKLLSGHLLFSYESGSERLWVQYDTMTFSQTFQGQANTPQRFTLHWRWPYVLSDVRNDPVIASWMSTAPDWFFYAGGGNLPTMNLSNNFKALNECYNNADQYIGEHISGLLLRLTAMEG